MKLKTNATIAAIIYYFAEECARRLAAENGIDLEKATELVSAGIDYKVVVTASVYKRMRNIVGKGMIRTAVRLIAHCMEKESKKWTRLVDCRCIIEEMKKRYGVTPAIIQTILRAGRLASGLSAGASEHGLDDVGDGSGVFLGGANV